MEASRGIYFKIQYLTCFHDTIFEDIISNFIRIFSRFVFELFDKNLKQDSRLYIWT